MRVVSIENTLLNTCFLAILPAGELKNMFLIIIEFIIGSLFDNICRLKTQVLKVKQEKTHVEEKMKMIEVQLISLGRKNEILEKDNTVSKV